MNLDPKLIDKIYNAFDPFETLQPGDPAYVDCGDVRGSNINQDLGKRLLEQIILPVIFMLVIVESGNLPN